MKTIHIDDYDKDRHGGRYRVVIMVVTFFFALLIFRLGSLQIVQGKRYEKMSRAQKLRVIVLPAVRGDIVDRHGHPLATTREAFQLLLYADPTVPDIPDLTGTISELLNYPKEEIQERFELRNQTALFQPIPLVTRLTRDEVAAIEENLTGEGGLKIQQITRRVYPQLNSASQLIGYMGEVTGKELDPQADTDYRMGDFTGRQGLEEGWESTLKGYNGKQVVVVDSTGRRNELFEKELRLPETVPSTPGHTLELTIDLGLQRATEEALGDVAGAAVVMDVRTGELLALASTPGFDPNRMIGRIDPEMWDELNTDPRHPFHNKPIQGQYPPASVFKIAVIAAALEEEVIPPTKHIRCKGFVEMGANMDKYHCWHPAGHGYVDYYRGVVESCDVYFYRIGEMLGIDKIREYAFKFGMGKKPGLGIPGEKSGLVPGPIWKKRFIGKPWYLGDTIITAIGQGYTLVTPLQAVRLASVIASGGKLLKPQLVRRVIARDGTVIKDFVPEVEISRVISPEVCSMVTQAMVGVINDGRGTGYKSVGEINVQVAGKTGTAQVVSRKRKAKLIAVHGEIPWKFRDHAWFVAFAPATDPRIAVSVLVEHGGPGSVVAAPICGEIIKHYIANQHSIVRSRGGSP